MEYILKSHNDYIEYITIGAFCVESEEIGVAALVSHPEWRRGCRLLADHSRSPAGHLSVSEINEIANITTKHFMNAPPRKLAIIVGDTVTFGQVTVWDTIASDDFPIVNKTFFDRNDALQWLLSSND